MRYIEQHCVVFPLMCRALAILCDVALLCWSMLLVFAHFSLLPELAIWKVNNFL